MRCSMFVGLLFAALALTGCQVNPATGQRQLILLPADQVAAMGAAAMPDLVREYGGEIQSQPVRTYVDEVGNRLLKHVEPEYKNLEWEFIVLDSNVINAFALPGGKVFISRGLMEKFTNEAQLAGVLGHEIGHVTGRHVDERISQAIGLEVIVAGIGVASDADWAGYTQAIVGLGGQGYLLSFGRGQESEADRLGVRYMVGARYDPHAMLEVMQILRDASEGASPPEFLSTHPHPETRIRQINDMLAGEYAYTQENPDFTKRDSRYQDRALSHLRAEAGPGHPLADALLAAFGSRCAHSCCTGYTHHSQY